MQRVGLGIWQSIQPMQIRKKVKSQQSVSAHLLSLTKICRIYSAKVRKCAKDTGSIPVTRARKGSSRGLVIKHGNTTVVFASYAVGTPAVPDTWSAYSTYADTSVARGTKARRRQPRANKNGLLYHLESTYRAQWSRAWDTVPVYSYPPLYEH